ncbi:MAG: DUF503 domain-containing protein [Deltaproteobacteria bacterium]|nr:DUF503 domain-containing protein [Deltaproteobacteria bacterium]MBW2253375.1 DUF503 domain-containing protein [Deltaproteobacteria bacterium]
MVRTVHIGVLHLVLRISGARTLKDRRQVVRSLRDRVRHRFDVTWHEVEPSDSPARCGVVCTTGGNDSRLIRSILDRVHRFVEQSGHAWPETVDLDVFPWHPPDGPWHMEETTDG